MLKNRIWLGIILSIILLVFSIPGFTSYYKYTQESGTNFYVGIADKADALEDTNEMRQIIDDLGALLVHSKRDDLYPKDETTGGTIQIPEAGLKFSNAPVNNDIAAYIAGEMAWQTKAELGFDLSLYYLKTEIDTLGEVETIYTKDIIDSDELAALKFTDLADTPANYTDQAGKYVKVNAGETALEFGTPAGGGTYLELTDTPAAYDNGKYAKSTADGVIWDDPAGAGDMTKAVYDTDTDNIVDKAETVDDGVGNSSTAADVEDAVTKKHSQNTDTDLDSTFEATFVKKTDTINVLSDITSTGANIEDAVTKKHTSGSETLSGDVSGTVGSNTVNKIKGYPVDMTDIANLKILKYNSTSGNWECEDESGGVSTFVELTDTPANYTDKANKLVTVNSTPDGLEFSDIADTDLIKCRNNAVSAPTVNDDSGDGYAVNSVWGDVTNDKSYVCVDSTVSSAVWKEISPLENFDFYNALASDLTYSGEIDSQPVGESVVFGDLLYFNWADKEWKKAKADAYATTPAERIALESKADGEICLMLAKGYIRCVSAFDFGASRIFLNDDTAGTCDDTAPAESGDQIQIVGTAKSADILFFNPSIDVGEI